VLPDEDRTKEQLVSELALLRQRVAELEKEEAERKQAEQALQLERDKLTNILDSMRDEVYIINSSCELEYVNPTLEAQFGPPKGRKCYAYFVDRQDVCPWCCNQEVFAGKTIRWEWNSVKTQKTYDIISTPLQNADGSISKLSMFRDLTERKQAEEALRESESRFSNIAENALAWIWEVNINGEYTYVSPVCEKILGYKPEELLGKHFYDLFLPEEREQLKKAALNTFAKKQPFHEFINENMHKNGERVWLSTSGVPILDERGNLLGYRGADTDLTDRKQAEEREKELQQELSISSRLAAVGELAAGVAHEINNPLTGVLGFSERLLRKSTDEEVRQDLERIHNEAQRITKVMDNLRTFTRRREPEKQYSDINDILQMTLELRAYELRTGNIEVVTDFTPSLPEVEVNSHQIQEVFLNIILNAEQVMTEAHGGGKLTIKTGKIKDYVKISFTDDGPGIPAEHLDRLFDPFFTTRGEQGGTGLGLSVCHGIVTEHGGRLYVKSKPGEGATFFVKLPLTSEKIDESRVVEEQPAV